MVSLRDDNQGYGEDTLEGYRNQHRSRPKPPPAKRPPGATMVERTKPSIGERLSGLFSRRPQVPEQFKDPRVRELLQEQKSPLWALGKASDGLRALFGDVPGTKQVSAFAERSQNERDRYSSNPLIAALTATNPMFRLHDSGLIGDAVRSGMWAAREPWPGQERRGEGGTTGSRGNRGGGGSFGQPEEQPMPEEGGIPEFGRDLYSYLTDPRISELISSMQGDVEAPFSAQEADLERRAAEGDARIAAIYNGLNQRVTGADATYKQIGDDAIAQTQANTNSAADAVARGNSVGQDTMAQARANLGAPQGISGDQLAASTNASAGVIGQRGQAASQFLTGQTASNRTYNQDVARSGEFRGAETRSALQSDLLSQLAELADARASAVSSARQNAFNQMMGLGSSMYEADYGQFRDERDYTTGRDDEAWNRALQQMDMQSQGSAYEPTADYEKSMLRMQQQGLGGGQISAIMAALGSAEYSAGGNPVKFAQDVERELRAQGADERTISIARQEAMEYFKAYR